MLPPSPEDILNVIRHLTDGVAKVEGCLVRVDRDWSSGSPSSTAPLESGVREWLVQFGGDKRQAELMINHVHILYLLDVWHRGLVFPYPVLIEVKDAYVALLRDTLTRFCGADAFEIVVTGEAEAMTDPDELQVSFCSKHQ